MLGQRPEQPRQVRILEEPRTGRTRFDGRERRHLSDSARTPGEVQRALERVQLVADRRPSGALLHAIGDVARETVGGERRDPRAREYRAQPLERRLEALAALAA